MSLKHGLLGLLNYGAMTGYDLDKAFKNSLGNFWKAQTSQIYRELTTMTDKGWLSFEMIYQDDKPNKKLYSLTDQGRQELLNWLMDSTIKEGQERNPFLMKIFFCGERNTEDTITILNNYIQSSEKHLSEIEKTREMAKTYETAVGDQKKIIHWQATALYGTYYYKMCIEWAKDVISRLEDLNQ